jgi:hypothetical protein
MSRELEGMEMRLQTLKLGATLIWLVSGLALAQSSTQNADPLYARLSYTTGHVVDWKQEKGNPRICLAIYRSGYYRVSRLTESGTETLQGTLSADQALRLHSMLEHLAFQSSGGAVTRNGAAMFVAEIVRRRSASHYVWINPDHQRPFPSSAMSIIKWLQDFTPEDALPLTVRELSDSSICPIASEGVLPLLASLDAAVVGSSCKRP